MMAGETSKKINFYVNPKGAVIPANRKMFDYNLSNMVEQNGKYIGKGSNGSVRVRVDDAHQPKLVQLFMICL